MSSPELLGCFQYNTTLWGTVGMITKHHSSLIITLSTLSKYIINSIFNHFLSILAATAKNKELRNRLENVTKTVKTWREHYRSVIKKDLSFHYVPACFTREYGFYSFLALNSSMGFLLILF